MSDKTVALMLEHVFADWRARGLINDLELMEAKRILWKIH